MRPGAWTAIWFNCPRRTTNQGGKSQARATGGSVKKQLKQPASQQLRQAKQGGGATAERLEPERPSWLRKEWPLPGASTPLPGAKAAVPSLWNPKPESKWEPDPPLPALQPPVMGCNGIFSSEAAFKMAAPLPCTPSTTSSTGVNSPPSCPPLPPLLIFT